MPKILIVEAEPKITTILTPELVSSEIEADHAASATEALAMLSREQYKLVLLSIALSESSEFDLCLRLCESAPQVPVVFLAPAPEKGRDMDEFRMRMKRFIIKVIPQLQTINVGGLSIDLDRRAVKIMGKMVSLGRKELDILILLARRPGAIVTRENILTAVYDDSGPYDRTVDSHMSHLRRKLREAAGKSLQITSVYGHGYRLEWNARAAGIGEHT